MTSYRVQEHKQCQQTRADDTLRKLLKQSDSCVLAPCVYDCASARAVELVGFKAMMLGGGAHALQLEDSTNMEKSTELLPREEFYTKIKVAVAALKGTDCVWNFGLTYIG